MSPEPSHPIKAVLFDFDGTISTLRCGWEEVMEPLMAEVLGGDETLPLVRAYIDESTGIQTIFQMKWLAEQARARGLDALDPWAYKDIYNRRLMVRVEEKLLALERGQASPEDFLMAGAADFLRALKEKGVRVYGASGTDHPDVLREARALGVYGFFDDLCGAPLREESCSKEKVLGELIGKHGLSGGRVCVIGDGKVEIRLGKAAGALAIGLASDERARRGVNPVKKARLVKAGADAILGDFLDQAELLELLGLGGEA